MGKLARRRLGWRLLILDAAQPPDGPDITRLQMALFGLRGGLSAGLIAWLLIPISSVRGVVLKPEAASST